jgi:hypothetical protein
MRPVADSPEFDIEFVVNRYSQTLPAANMAFRNLHRDTPEAGFEPASFGL